jgi:hypothetical protein
VATPQTELAALRDELAALTTAYLALLARVDAVVPNTTPTMAKTFKCPACNTTRIARVESILDRGESNAREEMALVQPSFWSSKVVGKLGCYACTGCGLVEWYVKDPSELKDVEGKITITDSAIAPSRDPYR